MVTKTPILVYYKQGLKTIVETDFSDNVNSRVFSQLKEDELLHLIMFFSKNLNLVEYDYKIYDK